MNHRSHAAPIKRPVGWRTGFFKRESFHKNYDIADCSISVIVCTCSTTFPLLFCIKSLAGIPCSASISITMLNIISNCKIKYTHNYDVTWQESFILIRDYMVLVEIVIWFQWASSGERLQELISKFAIWGCRRLTRCESNLESLSTVRPPSPWKVICPERYKLRSLCGCNAYIHLSFSPVVTVAW